MIKLTKDRKGGAFALVLIIILIIGAVLIIPQMVSGEGFSFDGILDSIQEFIGSLTGGGATDGYVGVGFTVYYADGSNENFGASPTFQISPLSITVTGKTVDRMDVIVRAKFTSSDITAWSSEVEQQIEVYKKPSQTPQYSSTGYFSESGDSWGAGSVKSLAVTVLDVSVIDNLVSDYGVGNWLLQVNVNVDLEATIDGVNNKFTGLAPSGGIDFSYTTGDDPPTLSVTTGTAAIS